MAKRKKVKKKGVSKKAIKKPFVKKDVVPVGAFDEAKDLLSARFGLEITGSSYRWYWGYGEPLRSVDMRTDHVRAYVDLTTKKIWEVVPVGQASSGVTRWEMAGQTKSEKKPPLPKLGKKELRVLRLAVQHLQVDGGPPSEGFWLGGRYRESSTMELVELMAGFTLVDLEKKLTRMIDAKGGSSGDNN